MTFPYGNAALAILLVAVVSLVAIATSEARREKGRDPDLVFATFTKEHAAAYGPAIREFEEANNVKGICIFTTEAGPCSDSGFTEMAKIFPLTSPTPFGFRREPRVWQVSPFALGRSSSRTRARECAVVCRCPLRNGTLQSDLDE